ARAEQFPMVFRAGQRSEIEKFQEIDRKFLLDYFDVAQNGLDGVARESDDIAGIGDDAALLPGQKHLAVFGNVVLLLLGSHQVVRIDVLEPDEHPPDTGPAAFVDEIRQSMAERIDLNDECGLETIDLT